MHASLQLKAEGLETWKTSWVKAGLERRLNRGERRVFSDWLLQEEQEDEQFLGQTEDVCCFYGTHSPQHLHIHSNGLFHNANFLIAFVALKSRNPLEIKR